MTAKPTARPALKRPEKPLHEAVTADPANDRYAAARRAANSVRKGHLHG